jgi:hypothetical protein
VRNNPRRQICERPSLPAVNYRTYKVALRDPVIPDRTGSGSGLSKRFPDRPVISSRHVQGHYSAQQLITLAIYHKVPAIYSFRDSAEAGGLMSYGANFTDAHRQLGVYTSRILKG